MTHLTRDLKATLRRIANSLVTRLTAMGFLVAIVGTVLTYTQLTRFLREDLTQVVSAQEMALAEYVAHDIDDDMTEHLGFLDRLAAALPPELLLRPEALDRWLGEQHDLRPIFALGLAVLDADAKVLGASAGARELAGGWTRADPGFRSALAGKAAIGRPQIVAPAASSPRHILPFAAPVKDGSGRTVAVLFGSADLSAHGFLERLLQGRIGQSGGILLISPSDRLFVASTRPEMLMKPTPPAGINALHDRAMAGFRGTGLTVNADGTEEISAIASVPSTGWFVVARLPTSEALATVARTQSFILRRRLPAVLIVLLMVGLIVMWLLRPLFRAANQADKMTRGELPLAPLAVARNDEVGHLTSSFNRLLSKLGEHEKELALLAYYDSLTGLPNRKLLADRLQQALARAQRNGTCVAVLFFDLDGFKAVNDSLGHEAGDEVLRQIAARLTSVLRQSDTVARLGGDEFVLLAADLAHAGDAQLRVLAQKCIDAIAMPLRVRDTEHRLGASVGIAMSNGRDQPEELLATADRTMYTVKQAGLGGYAIAAAPA